MVSQKRTYCNVEQVAEHALQQDVLLIVLVAQERIVVDLKEPRSEIFVDQEVVAKKLPTIFSLFLINLIFDCKDSVNADVLHRWKHVLLNVDAMLRILLVQKLLKFLKRNGVSDFVSSKGCLILYLQTIVGEMRHQVIWINIVFFAGGSEVTFCEEMEIEFIWIVLNVD